MQPDFESHFRLEELQQALLWSETQGPWGKALQVVADHRIYGEVLEVFAPCAIVARWRLWMEGGRIRVNDHLGATELFGRLADALSWIGAASDESDLAWDQALPE